MSLSQFVSKRFGKVSSLSAADNDLVKGVEITATSGVMLTASQLLSGSIVRSAVSTSPTVDGLPSAADLVHQLNIATNTKASAGMSFTCQYTLLGSSTNHNIVTAGSGVSAGGASLTFTQGSATGACKKITVTLATLSGTNGSFFVSA